MNTKLKSETDSNPNYNHQKKENKILKHFSRFTDVCSTVATLPEIAVRVGGWERRNLAMQAQQYFKCENIQIEK